MPEMSKRFNVTGLCIPQKHYMVNLTGRLVQVKEMVDEGAYFWWKQLFSSFLRRGRREE